MEFETPDELLARLKLGREEFCQRLLTSLILNGPYPKWNTRSVPSPDGLRFLQAVYEANHQAPWPGDDCEFVDELELAPRNPLERGGAPDYAILWDDRTWLIELKTEKGSHRADQVPTYFSFAHHHFPAASIDLLYLTSPMTWTFRIDEPWASYAHTTWGDVADVIRRTWAGNPSPSQALVVNGLLDAINSLHLSPSEWRAAREPSGLPTGKQAMPEPSPPITAPVGRTSTIDGAIEAASLTANDGIQRAVQFDPVDLDDLLDLRLQLRGVLSSSAPSSPLLRVLPWMWRYQSGGAPLTEVGRDRGMEIRLSRYRQPQY